jgi:hypothetical protein
MVSSKTYLFAPPGVIASWIRQEDLDRVRRTVPPAVYRRFYENVWTDSTATSSHGRCLPPASILT